MARRQLDASFWDDADVATLDPMERLLLICMITDTSLSDDYGRLPAHPAILKKHAFGYDDYTVEQVRDWSQNIIHVCHNVQFYVVDGQGYIELRNFERYQSARYKRRSNLPAPPDGDSQNITRKLQTISEDSRTSRDEMSRVELSSDESTSVELSPSSHENPYTPLATSPQTDDDDETQIVARIFSIWEDRFGRLTDIQRQEVAYRLEDHGAVRLCEALEATVANNGHSIAYLDTVLANWGKGKPRSRASPANKLQDEPYDFEAYGDALEEARERNDREDDSADEQSLTPS